MADIFAEVDEAMRQERLAQFWKENGTFIVVLIILTIVSTGAISGYRSWNDKQTKIQTNKALALTKAEIFPENIQDVDLSDMRAPLRALVTLNAAGAYLEDNKRPEAQRLLTSVLEEGGKTPLLSGAAKTGLLKLNKGENIDVNAMSAPWKPLAQLEYAVFLVHQKKDHAGAIAALNNVLDTAGLPSSVYTRANALKHLYSMQMKNPQSDKDS